MTKEITKARILQEIQDKFKLREYEEDKFLFSEVVVPTYDVGPHLSAWKIARSLVTITSATHFVLTTVPKNQQWTVRSYCVIFAGGAYTIAGVYIVRENPTYFMYLDLTAAQSVSYLKTLENPVILNPGDVIEVNADGYTSSGSLQFYMDYKIEEIR